MEIIILLILTFPCFFVGSRACPPNQRDSLFEFAHSFVLHRVVWPPLLWSPYTLLPPRDGPDFVASYPKTASWNLSVDCCGWDGVTCDESTGNVIGLNLRCSWLHGPLRSNSTLFHLPHLRSLDLSGNDFHGSTIPPEISVLEQLTHLNLSWGNLSGHVPSELSRLNKLVSLDLCSLDADYLLDSSFRIDGSSLERIAQNLSNLSFLDLSGIYMFNTMASSLMNLSSQMMYLSFRDCGLQGELPGDIFHLPNLRHLDLSGNSVAGALPESNWTTPLVFLDLSRNSLTGRLLDSVQQLKTLKALHLDYCGLTGVLPSWVGNQTEMTSLRLSGNQLIGRIPRSIRNLNKLMELDLSRNELSGDVDLELFSAMKDLHELRLTIDDRTDYGSSNYSFPNLEVLVLSLGNLTRFPYFIRSLDRLIRLSLYANKINGSVPSWFWNVSRDTLEVLDLGDNHIEGEFQFPWSKLMDIRLLQNSLQGPLAFPPPSVVFFDVSYNNFTGTIDNSFCQLHSLRHLTLSHNNLFGTLPTCLGNSSSLEFLDLSDNNFTGTIDNSFCQLPRSLGYLTLSHNNLFGTLPTCLGNSTSLEFLDLSDNNFTGTIDNSLCQLPPSLRNLNLAHNNLFGTLPTCLGNSSSLGLLDLSDNNFTGTFGNSFCQLRSLLYLILAHNNLFGTLPTCSGNSTQLFYLDLSDNNFHGEVPRYLANTTGLYLLNLSCNRLEDTIPSWLGGSTAQIPFKNLGVLDISNNNFQGSWPTDVLQQSWATYVDLSDNHFHGPIPSPPPQISFFSASNNKFSGKIPSTICSATVLQVLDLSNNSLEGNLPPCLINLNTNDFVLNLRMNKIGGIIPEILRGENGLRTLDLSQNRFTGKLPPSLQRCRQLQVLDLSDNLIEDTFPNWLGALPELKILILRSNKFHGVLNASIGLNAFSNLRILDLSKNNFSGLLPGSYFTSLKSMITSNEIMSYLEYSPGGINEIMYDVEYSPSSNKITSYSKHFGLSYRDSVTVQVKGLERTFLRILSRFTSIDLSENGFWGPIPAEIGMLKSLKGLNLSRNGFTRSIPPSIGDLCSLEWLDLSANMLDGVIPQHLSDITSLAVLNLSENQLSGRIPTGRQFNTFGSSSFGGNPGLCGFQLPNSCSNKAGTPSPSHIGQKAHGGHGDVLLWWMAASLGYGPGLVLGISMGYIFLKTGRPTWLARFKYRMDAKVMKMSRREARSYQR